MRIDLTATVSSGHRARPDPAAVDPKMAVVIAELRRRDREVRAHETAHAAAGGGLVRGGPSFRYAQGPDGRRYVVAGEVQLDSSPEPGDPAATVAKMEQVRRAALAPARPSSQDLAVAARAGQEAARARAELLQQPDRRRVGTRIDLRA